MCLQELQATIQRPRNPSKWHASSMCLKTMSNFPNLTEERQNGPNFLAGVTMELVPQMMVRQIPTMWQQTPIRTKSVWTICQENIWIGRQMKHQRWRWSPYPNGVECSQSLKNQLKSVRKTMWETIWKNRIQQTVVFFEVITGLTK